MGRSLPWLFKCTNGHILCYVMWYARCFYQRCFKAWFCIIYSSFIIRNWALTIGIMPPTRGNRWICWSAVQHATITLRLTLYSGMWYVQTINIISRDNDNGRMRMQNVHSVLDFALSLFTWNLIIRAHDHLKMLYWSIFSRMTHLNYRCQAKYKGMLLTI